jgi:deazaflavin-dependent oxidoreductase (nitroreductase family)
VQPPRAVFRLLWVLHRLLDRMTGGRFDTRAVGPPSLWLTTLGRTSGKVRETAMFYLEEGPNLVIVASNAGADVDPAWWLNLRADPETMVRLPGQPSRPIHAREATREEHAALWPRVLAMDPNMAAYQRRTRRPIPVVVLEPREAT